MAVVVPFKASPQPKNSGPLAARTDPFDETYHPYVNASGQVVFEVVWVTDTRNKRNKASLQRRPSGDGSWLWELDAGEYMRRAPGKKWRRFDPAEFEQYPATRQRKVFNGVAPDIPYRLPELLKAVAAGHTICVAEDELEVEFLRGFGFCATCCAGSVKNWRPEHSAFLQDADVVLYNDAKIIAQNLAPIARRLRILPVEGDVVELHAEEFARRIAAAVDYALKPELKPPLNPRLAAALGYAEKRHWYVFPANLSFNKATGKFNKKSYKSAEYSGGANWGKTRDPQQIKKDFKRWPKANVGIPTGAENKIWVIEADTPRGHNVDGITSLRALEAKHGPLPQTLMAESPSGSLHFYFNWPNGIGIINSTSSIAPGIDVRGEGGMVIAPPSMRGDGAYRWLNDNPIADAPLWLIDLAAGGQLEFTRKSAGGNGGEAKVAEELDDPARFKVAEGFEDLFDPNVSLGDGITLDSIYPPETLAALRGSGLTNDAIWKLSTKEAHNRANKILGIETFPRASAQELLNASGIFLKSYSPGEHSTTCPKCSHDRKKKKTKCLSIKIDDDGACWHCNHCNWSGPEKGQRTNDRANKGSGWSGPNDHAENSQSTNHGSDEKKEQRTNNRAGEAYLYHAADGAPGFRKIRAYDKDGIEAQNSQPFNSFRSIP